MDYTPALKKTGLVERTDEINLRLRAGFVPGTFFASEGQASHPGIRKSEF